MEDKKKIYRFIVLEDDQGILKVKEKSLEEKNAYQLSKDLATCSPKKKLLF